MHDEIIISAIHEAVLSSPLFVVPDASVLDGSTGSPFLLRIVDVWGDDLA